MADDDSKRTAEEEVAGTWVVEWFCAGDLFLPRQWLRMRPGALYQSFSLSEDRLTMHFPGGSGGCDERYERVPTTGNDDASNKPLQPTRACGPRG
jgi:hypothetical protein